MPSVPKIVELMRQEWTEDRLRVFVSNLLETASAGDARAQKLVLDLLRSGVGDLWGPLDQPPNVQLQLDIEGIEELLRLSRSGQIREEHVAQAFKALALKAGLQEAQKLDEIEAQLEALKGRRGDLFGRAGWN